MRIELVENIKEKMRLDNEYTEKVAGGKTKIRNVKKTVILTPEIFYKVFSPQRTKLILHVQSNKTMNIYMLAKALNRKYEAVHRDIKFLKGLGILNIKEIAKKKIPSSDRRIEVLMTT
jgi:predicted transcriptional regulator